MRSAGSIRPLGGGVPMPDADRVAALQSALADHAGHATFAEPAHTALASLNDRTLAETRTSDLGECATLLAHIRERVAGFDLSRLEPHRGLVGLFDSRKARLIRFREDFQSALRGVTQAASDLADRATAIGRKGTVLDALCADLRAAVVDIDAHLTAIGNVLGARTVPEDAEGADRPDALAALAEALVGTRTTGLARLPLVRATQNADHAVPGHLAAIGPALEAWREDWTDALGLKGKRPKKVRPEQGRLVRGREALLSHITSAERAITAAQVRRAEIEARLARPVSSTSADI